MELLLRSIAFHGSVQILLTHLLGVYYTEHRGVCTVRTSSEDVWIGGTALPQLHLLLNGDNIEGEQLTQRLQQAVEAGCGGFVVTERTLVPFLDRFYEAHAGATTQVAVKRLIAVTTHLNGTLRSRLLAHEAFESLVNFLLLVPNATAGTVELYTTRLMPAVPVGVTVELVKIGELLLPSDAEPSSSFPFPGSDEQDYFPDKLSNMRGRRIRVSTVMYPPCTSWTEVPLGQGNAMAANDTSHALQLDGLELILTLEFCRRHNCTLELVLGTDWGIILDNGSTTGLIDEMVHRRADLVLGAIYQWHSWWQLLSISAPIGISSVTSLVPKPRLLPFWQTPFLSFPASLWLMVGVTFVAGTLAIAATDLCRQWLLDTDERSSGRLLLLDALFFMLRLYVEQSAGLRNDLLSAVLLLTALLFGGFMIGNSYAGSLASIMTLPRYEPSIDTAADFVAAGMRWTGVSNAWMNSLLAATNPAVVRMRNSFEVHDDATRARMPFTDRRMGYIFEQLQYGNYAFGTVIDTNASLLLQPLREMMFREYTSGFCSKVWPLRTAYDTLILELHQSGIFHYLEFTSVMRLFGLTVQRNIGHARLHEANSEPVKLTIDHFLGVFFILFFGLCLATATFVAELVVHKWYRSTASL